MEDDTATWAGTTVGGAGRCGKNGGIVGVPQFRNGLGKETGRLTYFASLHKYAHAYIYIYIYIYNVCVLTISAAWVCFVFRSCLVYRGCCHSGWV